MKKLFTLIIALLAIAGVGSAQTFEWYVQGTTETYNPTTGDVITFSGSHNTNAKYIGVYKASDDLTVDCKKGLKIESSTVITINNQKEADIIIVQSTAANDTRYPTFDNNALTDADVIDTSANGDVNVRVYSKKNVAAGTHTIGRKSEYGIIYIGVTYIDNGLQTLDAPVITYDENMLVTISKPEGAVKVCYTIDGTEPTAESTEYTAPFTAEDGTVVKAIAIGDGTTTDNSLVASVTVLAPITEVAAPVFTQYNGTFALTCATAGATLEYSIDGTTFVPYTIPVTFTETTTVSARATYGELTSEVATQEITALPAVEKTSTVILDYKSFTQTNLGTADALEYVFEGTGDYVGYSLKMADAPAKTWGFGAEITVNGQKHTSIHGSNGQTITVSVPEGYKATRIVLYSVEPAAGNTSTWTICGDANPIELVSADGTNPDIRISNIAEGAEITFKNSNIRPDFVIALDIIEPAATSATLVAYNVKGQTNAGYTISGTTVAGNVTVNGVKIPSLQLKNGWDGTSTEISTETTTKGNNFIKLETAGGFKKGDILTVNGVISNSDPNKNGAISVYADNGETQIGESGLFVNTNIDKTAPASEYVLTLPCDAEVLYITRAGVASPTATQITMIKLERSFEPIVVEPLADPVVMIDGVKVTDINLENGMKTITVQGAEAHHIIYYNTNCEYVAPAEPSAAPARIGAATLTHDGVVYKLMPAEGVVLDKNGTFSVIAHDPATDARSAVSNLTVSGGQTTAITEIEAAQGEAVYYNLQGQKVETPAAGLYIRVLGGKAEKVVVK